MIDDMRIGDWVRVIGVPPNLGVEVGLNTRTLFENCLGKCFHIKAIQHVEGLSHPLAELHVGHVVGRQPPLESIWVEPEYLDRVELYPQPTDRS